MELLEALRSHPYLKTRVALKGGTALNLFVFDVPRLSVDVDLNYVGAAEVGTMKQERPKVDQAIQAVCGRIGIGVRRIPSEHAGGAVASVVRRGQGPWHVGVGRELPLADSALANSSGRLAVVGEVRGHKGPGSGPPRACRREIGGALWTSGEPRPL